MTLLKLLKASYNGLCPAKLTAASRCLDCDFDVSRIWVTAHVDQIFRVAKEFLVSVELQ